MQEEAIIEKTEKVPSDYENFMQTQILQLIKTAQLRNAQLNKAGDFYLIL